MSASWDPILCVHLAPSSHHPKIFLGKNSNFFFSFSVLFPFLFFFDIYGERERRRRRFFVFFLNFCAINFTDKIICENRRVEEGGGGGPTRDRGLGGAHVTWKGGEGTCWNTDRGMMMMVEVDKVKEWNCVSIIV